MAKILITGASGLIGTRLTEMLISAGHSVAHLGRGKKKSRVNYFTWDIPKRFVEKDAFKDVDTIIHLAGAGIADKPWTEARKREILESRTFSSRLLADELRKGNHTVKNFISASAIGYYGFEDDDKEFVESDAPGNDFLAQVVKKWEEEVDKIDGDIRVVKIRVGIVLSMDGGALKEIARPVKMYVGAPLGSGKQYVSWIHIDDLCRIFVKAVEEQSMRGSYNGVGPYAVTNAELTHAIAKALHRPILLPPVPPVALKLLFGEMADLVLRGNRVSAKRLIESGFQYRFNTLETALADLVVQKR